MKRSRALTDWIVAEGLACVVEALRAHDGQVLKFVGDGILAIFKRDGSGAACAKAIAAADTMLAAVAELNEKRRGRGQPITDIYLALHLGEVLYGNVGSWDPESSPDPA